MWPDTLPSPPLLPPFTLCHEVPQDILQALEHGRGDLEVGSVLHGAHLALPKEPICKRGEAVGPDGRTTWGEGLQAQPHHTAPQVPLQGSPAPSTPSWEGRGDPRNPSLQLLTLHTHLLRGAQPPVKQAAWDRQTDRQAGQHSL